MKYGIEIRDDTGNVVSSAEFDEDFLEIGKMAEIVEVLYLREGWSMEFITFYSQ